jgi:hypothetical protein
LHTRGALHWHATHHPHLYRGVPCVSQPTNHLSIDATEALALACREFKGAVVVASHNRYFVSLVCNCSITLKKDGSVESEDLVDVSSTGS